jgi:DNA-binding response OmpR family regulator
VKVLTVDDDVRLADIIDRNLKARGHSSRHAGSVQHALTELSDDWPDVVILDLNLPDSSGWELLYGLSEEQRQALRVIVVSASPISRGNLKEFGLHSSLQKPFALEALMNLIES